MLIWMQNNKQLALDAVVTGENLTITCQSLNVTSSNIDHGNSALQLPYPSVQAKRHLKGKGRIDAPLVAKQLNKAQIGILGPYLHSDVTLTGLYQAP